LNICHVNLARGFSGGESQTLLLIKEQLSLGYAITAVAKKNSPFAAMCQKLDLRLIETSHFLLSHSKQITQHCESIHVHEGQAIYWALIQHLLHRTPYIVTRRIDNPFKKKWLSNLAYRNARFIVGVSRAIQNIAEKQFPEAQVCSIPDSPVSYQKDAESVRKLKKRFAGKFIVMQAAKLYKHKGFDVTVQAARQLEAKHPDIHFCLLGDGPEFEHLQQLASGLSNLEFLGRQSDMGNWFSLADILVLPSYTEGMGSVLLEASLAGVPVIGTKAGGIPDAIEHETNGLLIDIGDSEGLAQAILRIKDNPELRAKIKEATPEFIAGFDIQVCAERYSKLYHPA
jgi:L-malate glycosyltransferase